MAEESLSLALRDRIEQVRVAGASSSDAALRVRLRSQVAASELRPRGMPPSAILLVRSVGDPLPGALGKEKSLGCDRRWQSALDAELEATYCGATRPRLGRLAADADAVLFADPAELVAVWLIALCEGRTHGWWWSLLSRRLLGQQKPTVARLLALDARLAPATLAAVAAVGELLAVVTRLSLDRMEELEELEHGLCRELAVASKLFAIPGSESPVAGSVSPSAVSTPGLLAHLPRASEAPWRPWLKVAVASLLAPRVERYVGIALGLFCDPGRVRSERFAREAQAWSQGAARRPPAGAVEETHFRHRQEHGDAGISVSLDDGQQPDTVEGIPDEHPKSNRQSPDAEHAKQLSSLATGAPTTSHAAGGEPSPSEPTRPPESPEDYPPAPLSGGESDGTYRDRSPATGVEDLEGLLTHWGGVLFLINVVREMEVLELFEDWRLHSEVGGWGVVELVARGLLTFTDATDPEDASEDEEQWRSDPIFSALAALDGRSLRLPPGSGFACGAEVVIPPLWRPLWRESVAGSVAPSLDLLPLPAETRPIAPDLMRWVEATTPWLAARISEACGDGFHLREALRCRGHLFVSATHVDLVAPLDQTRVGVRRAGLDRDPGWVPELGRIVSFVFE